MLFNSLSFAFFLIVVFILYWACPHKLRWVLLLISNYYFYMSWGVKYAVLLFLITLLSFLTALLIEKKNAPFQKKLLLLAPAIFSLGILFFYKYFSFFWDTIQTFLNLFSIPIQPSAFNLMLPVGISFYTFQTLGYVIDVYKGIIPAEHHFGKYSVFATFFPLISSGPIARAKDLLPQVKEERFFHYDQATYGLKLMAWGFFKKLVIADVLAKYVSTIYNSPYEHAGFALVLATFFYTIQIYCDFSGYSDIAIGVAKLFGIDLLVNFKSPYFSASIKEFWSRWHISLSSWFRDYVYIPLGGNRKGRLRTHANLIITFLVSGLWHGANWTFILWGLIHGFAQVLEKLLPADSKHQNTHSPLWFFRVILVFTFCSFAWIFFRADSLTDALYIITHLFSGITNPVSYILNGFYDIGLTKEAMVMPFLSIAILAVYDYLSLKTDVIELISSKPVPIRYAIYFTLLLIIMFFKASGEAVFVYFQF